MSKSTRTQKPPKNIPLKKRQIDPRTLALLNQWYERQKRVLPWRDMPTPYRVWISEIMLQQTQVATVIAYFNRFIERFPDVITLSQASIDEVLAQWSGLGYYRRARHLHEASQSLAQYYLQTGEFPKTRSQWLALKGVGEYTAGAVLSISFDQVEPILDGNVERVLSRFYTLKRDKNFKKNLWGVSKQWVERAAEKKIRPSQFNQAMMELGARICTPKSPQCPMCPLSTECRARKDKSQDLFPEPAAKTSWIKVQETFHLISKKSSQGLEVLLMREDSSRWRKGLWDLIDDSCFKKRFEKKSELRKTKTDFVQLVVTRHKIKRTVKSWSVSAPPKNLPLNIKWVSLAEINQFPHGASLKKSLKLLHEEAL
jgi:A/G-specific adenine glycosylase